MSTRVFYSNETCYAFFPFFVQYTNKIPPISGQKPITPPYFQTSSINFQNRFSRRGSLARENFIPHFLLIFAQGSTPYSNRSSRSRSICIILAGRAFRRKCSSSKPYHHRSNRPIARAHRVKFSRE